MCLKRKDNQYILRAFDVLDVLDRVDVSSMTFQVSRGPFRNFTFRCPEVGLELALLGVRGRIRNS